MNFFKKYWWVLLFLIIGIAAFFFFRNKGGADQREGEDQPQQESEEDFKRRMLQQCPNNWKVKEALKKGLIIYPEYLKKYEISDCDILGWMYEIKYQSSWGINLTGEQLYEAAQYQAALQQGKAK